MENKWVPCFCTILMGILVIVFTWWKVSWGPIALTVIGALMIVRGLINKCCCADFLKRRGEGPGCCQ